MNQRYDPTDKRFVNATTRPGERAADPVTGAPVSDPLLDPLAARDVNAPLGTTLGSAPLDAPKSRSSWPVLIILLAGLVLALLVWLPAEMNNSTPDTATQPAAPSDVVTPPVTNDAAPATTPTAPAPSAPAPSAPATTPDTSAAPVTPPAADTVTPPATGAQPQTNTAP